MVAFFIIVEASGLDFLLQGLGVDPSGRGLLTSVLPPLILEPLLLFLPVFFLSRLCRIVT